MTRLTANEESEGSKVKSFLDTILTCPQ